MYMVKKRGKSDTRSRHKKGNSYLYLANNNIKSKSKRSQEMFGLSFGMIFAVILIIFFVLVAFIVIKNFLCTRDQAQTGMFFSNLNTKVKGAWDSGDITSKYSIDLPTKIEAVCFANLSADNFNSKSVVGGAIQRFDPDDNLFLYAPKKTCFDLTSYYIEHINLEKITEEENPFCIRLLHGKGALIVEMDYSDKLVRILKE